MVPLPMSLAAFEGAAGVGAAAAAPSAAPPPSLSPSPSPLPSPSSSPSPSLPSPPPPDPPEPDVLFLLLHHLHQHAGDPDTRAALVALERALHAQRLLPTAHDYTGAAHPLSYAQMARRFAHIPATFLRDVLRARMPRGPHAPRSLLGTGRHAAQPRKRPRARAAVLAKERLRPVSRNVSVLVELQRLVEVKVPFQRMAFALLPKAFRRLKRLVGHHFPVFTAIFDHESRRVVTGSDDQLIKVWSTETGYLQHTLRGHDCNITEIVKHPTCPIIVSASSDTTLRVWDLSTGAALHVLDGGSKEVNVVQFSPCPDRPYLVSGGADGSVRLWNADCFQAGYIRIPIPERTRRSRTPGASSADTLQPRSPAAAATSRAAPSSPAADHLQDCSVSGVPGASSSQAASVVGLAGEEAGIASSTARATSGAGAVGEASVSAVANVRAPALGSAARQSTDQQPHQSRHPPANSIVSGTPMYEVLSVCFNAGATRLAVGGTDCFAHVYAVEKRGGDPDSPFPQLRLLTTLRGHSEQITQVLFARSGDSIVTACRDGTARIWNRTKARLPVNSKRKQSVSGMGQWSSKVLDCRTQLQADARSMLSGGASASACGSIVPRMRRQVFPVSVGAAMWSLTDKYVFTASSDSKIRVWHSDTGKLARVLEAHESKVYVMDCHPTNSRILLSAGYDGKCILWDIETGAQLRSFSVARDDAQQDVSYDSTKRPSISDGQFSPDGLSFALSDTSGAITLFGVGSGEATALAPEEQFFSNDCAPFRRDVQNRAVDENTGLLLHEVPKGRLCNKEFRVHPPELQPNLPLPTSTEESEDIVPNGKSPTVVNTSSPNAVKSRNRDVLLLRAQEFRENQEKEDRRLLRDAREARRRLIVEKEKAALGKDAASIRLPLRDFAVVDSEVESSDADFDCAAELEKVQAESSSSSDDEDKVRPQCRSRARRHRVEQIRGRERCKDLRTRQYVQNAADFSGESGVSEEEGEDGSSAYEVGSHDSDSDHSESSGDRYAKRRYGRVEKPNETGAKRSRDAKSSPSQLQPLLAHASGDESPPLSPAPSIDNLQMRPPLLGGALASSSGPRMKIVVTNKSEGPIASTRRPFTAENSRTDSPKVGDHMQYRHNTTLTQANLARASSAGSYDGRILPNETNGFVGIHATRNPSFTSERKEIAVGMRHVSKSVEDHQGDTASYVRLRRSHENIGEVGRSAPGHAHQQSSADKSLRTEKGANAHLDTGMQNGLGSPSNAASHALRDTGHEKSLLSDSPARLTKKKLRSGARSWACGNETEDIITPVVDIDELAERELEILEAERERQHGKKRRGKPIKSDSDEEHTDGGREVKRSRRTQRSGFGDVGKSVRPQRRRNRKSNLKGEFKQHFGFAEEDRDSPLANSAWLRPTSNKYTYVPQLGDDVMYFPEGHAFAVEISRESGLDPLSGKSLYRKAGKEMLDGTSFPKDSTPIRFQVIDLEYQFTSPTLNQKPRSMSSRGKSNSSGQRQNKSKERTMAVLTLRLLSGMQRRAGQGDRFVLLYYPVDAPEYLVLASRVELALNRSWKASDRFRILFLNERRAWQYYTGTIRNVKPTIRTVMWNSVEVEYDNEGEKDKVAHELVSPWELEAHDLLHGAREAHLQFAQSTRSSTVEPGLFPIIAREFETIRAMESNWRVQLSWLDTVDALAAIPGYCNKIPFPMDLNIILVRMCTGFYRHFWSFLHDLGLLKNNAIRFFGAESELGILSINVLNRLSETAERTRQQYLASMMTVTQNVNQSHLALANHSGSRMIRPRPAPNESAGQAGPPGIAGMPSAARGFPAPLIPRQSGAAFAVPSQFYSESVHGQRAWPGMRQVPVGSSSHGMYPGQSLGVALPPALPGVANGATAVRGSRRASRGSSKGQHSLRQNRGHSRQAGVAMRGSAMSPSLTTANNLTHLGVHGMTQGSMLTPHSAINAHSQHVQLPVVVNSSHTNDDRRSAAGKLAPSNALTNPQSVLRPGHTLSGVQATTRVQGSENGSANNAGACTDTAGASPSRERSAAHGVTGAAVSITQPSPHGAASRLQHRVTSTMADGGTHSWGRSMEGAGGIFALQASTSDSHFPLPMHPRRSHSPTSPPSRTELPSAGVGLQALSTRMSRATPAYHEHSTVSVAAAESTMSCGGVDVAMQAATAESAEVATERTRMTR